MTKISHAIRDAWEVKPPCMYKHSYCHSECPYIDECEPESEYPDAVPGDNPDD